MPRKRTGTVVEHAGRDGRIYRSLRFTSDGRRRFVSLGPVTPEQAETALADVVGAHPSFLEQFQRGAPDGCWHWQGSLHNGYGKFGNSDRAGSYLAHRVVYEHLVGPVPAGHDLHHTCENKRCVNPAHLVPLTRSEHLARHRQTADSGISGPLASESTVEQDAVWARKPWL